MAPARMARSDLQSHGHLDLFADMTHRPSRRRSPPIASNRLQRPTVPAPSPNGDSGRRSADSRGPLSECIPAELSQMVNPDHSSLPAISVTGRRGPKLGLRSTCGIRGDLMEPGRATRLARRSVPTHGISPSPATCVERCLRRAAQCAGRRRRAQERWARRRVCGRCCGGTGARCEPACQSCQRSALGSALANFPMRHNSWNQRTRSAKHTSAIQARLVEIDEGKPLEPRGLEASDVVRAWPRMCTSRATGWPEASV
jgi:hypothetical protein